MTDTHPVAPATDWRSYAAEIRTAILAEEAATGTPLSHLDPDAPEPLDILPDDRPAPDPLTARQAFLVLGLAATFGSRAALAGYLERRAIIPLTDVRSDLMFEIARLLRWALPDGFFVARGDPDRLRPGAVTVVKGAQAGWHDHEQLRLELTAALTFPAPVILLLPADVEPTRILGAAHAPSLRFRVFEPEIIAELLAQSYPGTDPSALIQHLPPDTQLEETPMLWLMLALRCESAEAAAGLLSRRGWPAKAESREERRRSDPSPVVRPDPGGIPLAELAGLGQAREIAIGITEDLRAWAAGTLDWRDVHRGLLIAGPPGTGKTELARAMAGSRASISKAAAMPCGKPRGIWETC